MSMRKLVVQYIGSTLCLPELERKVEEIAIRDKDFRIIKRFIPERTCHLERHGSIANWPEMVCWSCSECNFGWHHDINDKQFSYCPNCGSKVVEE